jgi:hypothetical protein
MMLEELRKALEADESQVRPLGFELCNKVVQQGDMLVPALDPHRFCVPVASRMDSIRVVGLRLPQLSQHSWGRAFLQA